METAAVFQVDQFRIAFAYDKDRAFGRDCFANELLCPADHVAVARVLGADEQLLRSIKQLLVIELQVGQLLHRLGQLQNAVAVSAMQSPGRKCAGE